jgi:hypothetical protein
MDCYIFGDNPTTYSESVIQQMIMDIKKNKIFKSNSDVTSGIEAGFTYFGQMIAHDIVPSTTLSIKRINVEPILTLKSIYGDNVDLAYFNYQGKFILGKSIDTNGNEFAGEDLYRDANGVALIPEPRNDENIIISQMHLFWQKFHNKIVDYLKVTYPNLPSYLDYARDYIIYIFNKVVVRDYLAKILHPKIYDFYFNKLNPNIFYDINTNQCIPKEFSHAVFRFGHSMVRDTYSLNTNSNSKDIRLRDLLRLNGGQVNKEHVIDWSFFFKFNNNIQSASKIDTKIINDMTQIILENQCTDIRDVNLTANFKSGVKRAGEIFEFILAEPVFDRLIKEELDTYQRMCAILFHLQFLSKINNLIYIENENYFNFLAKYFEDFKSNRLKVENIKGICEQIESLPLWVFVLDEAGNSRARAHSEGLGIVASIILAEVLADSSKKALNRISVNYVQINNFIKNELKSNVDSISFKECIKYVK